ncbi:3-isopropylmalate dehydratase small subunit [Streptomyces sp. TRM 70351]|uniref:3-isopropylmalate dehydratase small subunit n=1 Tax=Streptomyces sp. TRM 70351 TaxID=3116552 RepID=UPI002E7B7A28|nr:3-isopropylmalate dehydratase small subunit [Streptomyces sp. TRM 70351]MEE1930133.1 3-isopropylmalate dehydratase small subunit [Streptomyces sp. TRM 70351]
MEPIRSHVGRTVPLRRSDVDTDQICPAEFCKRVTRSGFDDALFARWRKEPGFVLTAPERAGASVLLAGPDFGTGSSREHAVWALRDWGFAVVLSSRFGDIFRRNALKNGLLALSLPEPVMGRLLDRSEADSSLTVTVDVAARTVAADGGLWSFDLDERTQWLLVNGFDDIDVTMRRGPHITAYEERRPYWLPTVGARSPQ